jgi:hypothetical protein
MSTITVALLLTTVIIVANVDTLINQLIVVTFNLTIILYYLLCIHFTM